MGLPLQARARRVRRPRAAATARGLSGARMGAWPARRRLPSGQRAPVTPSWTGGRPSGASASTSPLFNEASSAVPRETRRSVVRHCRPFHVKRTICGRAAPRGFAEARRTPMCLSRHLPRRARSASDSHATTLWLLPPGRREGVVRSLPGHSPCRVPRETSASDAASTSAALEPRRPRSPPARTHGDTSSGDHDARGRDLPRPRVAVERSAAGPSPGGTPDASVNGRAERGDAHGARGARPAPPPHIEGSQ